ncbi:hypothetical protein GQ54DRAFT_107838 [Martensiomyces pterosporus]|nr:hypothetical protein GQ54DRAFT_107838 [Martensiomyces pterosporus]
MASQPPTPPPRTRIRPKMLFAQPNTRPNIPCWLCNGAAVLSAGPVPQKAALATAQLPVAARCAQLWYCALCAAAAWCAFCVRQIRRYADRLFIPHTRLTSTPQATVLVSTGGFSAASAEKGAVGDAPSRKRPAQPPQHAQDQCLFGPLTPTPATTSFLMRAADTRCPAARIAHACTQGIPPPLLLQRLGVCVDHPAPPLASAYCTQHSCAIVDGHKKGTSGRHAISPARLQSEHQSVLPLWSCGGTQTRFLLLQRDDTPNTVLAE